MKKNFYTIILAANFVTSTALFCGNTASTAKKPCEAAAEKVETSRLQDVVDSVKASWTNHRNWYYVGGAVAVVTVLAAANKQCKGKCPLSYFSKKDTSKPANTNANQ